MLASISFSNDPETIQMIIFVIILALAGIAWFIHVLRSWPPKL